jgi:hypothetical protein
MKARRADDYAAPATLATSKTLFNGDGGDRRRPKRRTLERSPHARRALSRLQGNACDYRRQRRGKAKVKGRMKGNRGEWKDKRERRGTPFKSPFAP